MVRSPQVPQPIIQLPRIEMMIRQLSDERRHLNKLRAENDFLFGGRGSAGFALSPSARISAGLTLATASRRAAWINSQSAIAIVS